MFTFDTDTSNSSDSKFFKQVITRNFVICDTEEEEFNKLLMLNTFMIKNAKKVEVCMLLFDIEYLQDESCNITMVVMGNRKEVK